MFRLTHILLPLLLSQTLTHCQSSAPDPSDTNQQKPPSLEIPELQKLTSLEYFLRFNRQEFLNSQDPNINPKLRQEQLSWLKLLMPPALAELAPQYQQLFSLHLSFDHAARSFRAQWRYQMATDPSTAEYAQKTFGPDAYAQLAQDLALKPLACAGNQEQLAGPAPTLLTFSTAQGSATYQANGHVAAGPYICQDGLLKELVAIRSELSKVSW